jgi:hypothetical protein
MATKPIVRYRTRIIKTRHRSKAGMTVPIAVLAGFAPLAIDCLEMVNRYGIKEVPHALAYNLAGINTWEGNKFDIRLLAKGWAPIIGGLVVHKLASKMGFNRMLAQAGVPFLRI